MSRKTQYAKTMLDPLTYRRISRTIRELRRGGLTYKAIAFVLDLYEGVPLTTEQVRAWCQRLDLPKDPQRALAAHAGHAKRAIA